MNRAHPERWPIRTSGGRNYLKIEFPLPGYAQKAALLALARAIASKERSLATGVNTAKLFYNLTSVNVWNR
jgi:hypothetical protein